MKRQILILTLAFFVVGTYAQNSNQNVYEEWKSAQDEYADFDIGKFITPNIVRNLLALVFDLNANYSRTGTTFEDRDSRNESSNLNGAVRSNFSHYVNTRKIISSLSCDLSLSGSNLSQKNTVSSLIENESNLQQQHALSFGWANKLYFTPLMFMDYGISSNTFYFYKQDKTKNQLADSDQKQKRFTFDISPQIGVGIGRIENVRDARHAVYVANALSKRKVLTRNLSHDELYELSQKMSTVKNKRFLDSRLHLIDEIALVDSFFVNNNLLADNGPAYFTTLYDMWQYGDLFPRESGYELSFLVKPYYSHRNEHYTPATQDVIQNSYQYNMFFNFKYEKPFKLNWQHSLNASLSGSINSESAEIKQTNNTLKTKINSVSGYASYTLGYYPNTRTSIQVLAAQRIQQAKYDDGKTTIGSTTQLNAKLYYYFSPYLRLTGNYDLSCYPVRFKGFVENYTNRNIFNSLFNIQLTYMFF